MLTALATFRTAKPLPLRACAPLSPFWINGVHGEAGRGDSARLAAVKPTLGPSARTGWAFESIWIATSLRG